MATDMCVRDSEVQNCTHIVRTYVFRIVCPPQEEKRKTEFLFPFLHVFAYQFDNVCLFTWLFIQLFNHVSMIYFI